MARAECGFEGRPDELVQYGPTIVVRIGFSPEVSFDSGDRASLPSTQFFALVDTGASESCIDSAVAMELGLPVVDREMVAGVHGAAPANVHLAHIYIPAMDVWMDQWSVCRSASASWRTAAFGSHRQGRSAAFYDGL